MQYINTHLLTPNSKQQLHAHSLPHASLTVPTWRPHLAAIAWSDTIHCVMALNNNHHVPAPNSTQIPLAHICKRTTVAVLHQLCTCVRRDKPQPMMLTVT